MTSKYNEENIRLAAYYNWKNAGCPYGNDEYFWNQAINQLYGSSKSSCGCSGSAKKSTTSSKSGSSKSATKTSTAKTSTGTGTSTNKKTSSK